MRKNDERSETARNYSENGVIEKRWAVLLKHTMTKYYNVWRIKSAVDY